MEIIVLYGPWFIGLALLFGLYMTWGVGANDLANAMGTSVGAGALSVKQAIVIAALFEFAGAVLAGGSVTSTVRKGIIDPSGLEANPEYLVYGMLAALLAAGFWLMVASWKGWPVSTTHSIIGALVGFGIVGIGMESVQWSKVGSIVASWVVSPMVGGILAFLFMHSVRKLILNTEDPFESARKWGPYYIFLVGFVISLVTLTKGLKHLDVNISESTGFLMSIGAGIITAFVGGWLLRKAKRDLEAEKNHRFASVEKVFAPMMIFTACAMAFAHGSNDVANGIGPLAAVVSIVGSGGQIMQDSGLPIWVLLVGGVGIVTGLATMGYRVMKTIGTKITELTPTRGFCAELAAASTVVLASGTGLPVSTTHILVGAVMGVGLARGIGALDLKMIGKIVTSWIVTLPIAGIVAAVFFFILRFIFG
ncbi:MAG: inorganic phosphate transporter [Bacteroidetes Order II. Incertae sedis bacterium]|jgi:PiT family inorganic phosphate transporter|nr:inorganic phosphate transporter [Bacteroidetes Order II. bacterium]MBT4052357.1 inorganic phosphate transporter [Bacteroidetes Order II. bacterium]MBT4602941.1 inorganic phosphate transporter [Bacteroidetes Order II. bacterium]MBT5249180.1 inorganic phosphate transporter [Bacteroidetes Order II. bacterium]MBT6199542.1 inorganic phosphate transporter [Bacteroidetes Order II. bacterium]